MKEESAYQVGVLLYAGVEILEVAGPAEVFTTASGFEISSIGISEGPVLSRGGFRLLPDYALDNCPHLDVLVIPGGAVRPLLQKDTLLRWLQAMTIRTTRLMSVCRGAYLLAAAGLLEGRSYTSAGEALAELPKLVKGGRAVEGVRYVDSGNIITTAGPSSGIDGALHIVKLLQDTAAAQAVAGKLEYPLWPGVGGSGRAGAQRKSENTSWPGNK